MVSRQLRFSTLAGTLRALIDEHGRVSVMASIERAPEGSLEPRIGRSVSLDHAAELLGVSRRTIYNRIREGRLQTIRTLGGSQRVLLDSITDARDRGPTL
jgi:excisionase family DNA binding protein